MRINKEQVELIYKIKDKLMSEQTNGDTEGAHCNADDYLIELLNGLGLHDIVKEYSKIDKWYA